MPRGYFSRRGYRFGRSRSSRRRRYGFKRRKITSTALSHWGKTWKRPLTQGAFPTGFPDRMAVKLKYQQKLLLSVTAGVPRVQVFRGNDCFDPDFTGTGHQPNGYDQWSAFYSYQTVVASSIRAQVYSSSSGLIPSGLEWVIFPATLSTTLSSGDVTNAREQVYAKWRTVQAGFGTQLQASIRSYMSTAKMAGCPPSAISDCVSAYTGPTTASPSLAWYWHIYVNNIAENDSSDCIFDFEIDYYVIFTGRKNETQS